MTLHEVSEAAQIIHDAVDEDAVVTFGAVVDERIQGEIQITVIATGFELKANEMSAIAPITEATTFNPSSIFETIGGTTAQSQKTKELNGILDIPDFLKK